MENTAKKVDFGEFLMDHLKDGSKALIGTIGHTAVVSNLITAALELSAAKMVAKSDMSSYWKFATISALAGHAASLGRESLKVVQECSKAEKKVDEITDEAMKEAVEESTEDEEDLNDDPDITVSE